MATSPDGQSVYVAGTSDADPSSGNDFDYVVIAFNTSTGEQRWTSRYPGTADLSQAQPFALVVSPTGSAVFVTGNVSSTDGSNDGMATVAFAAATGEQLWIAPFSASTTDAAVSPDGTRVYVVGQAGAQNQERAVTIAYDAVTGEQVWLQHYAGDTGDRTFAFKVAANPDGSRLYVAGGKLNSQGFTSDVLLLVYDPVTGELMRETHHPTKGVPPAGIAVSQDGSRVFIAEANLETNLNNALTLAYDAAGNKLWTARFQGCDDLKCSSRPFYYGPITVSPDGTRVFVTSLGVNHLAETGFVTVAYDSATGQEQWATRYEANIGDCFCGPSVTVNPNGEEVYISGLAHITTPTSPGTNDITTLAYDSATGAQEWVAIFKESAGDSSSDAIAVSPNGDRVFVAGQLNDAVTLDGDLITLAFDTGVLPAVQPISAHSRKTHGTAGIFDIYLPLAGNAGIECRNGGSSKAHQIVFSFATAVTPGGASVTPAQGKTAEVDGPPISSADGKKVTVNLKNVTNVQMITVTLLGVSDGTNTNDVSVQMGVLLGDTTGERSVNSSDISQTKSKSGQAVTGANFRQDVTINGSINSSDISLVKSKSGTALP